MIVANLATYPPRRDGLLKVVASLSPQVDRLNVVLNEYAGTVGELAAYGNVEQILPPADLKDTGKFWPDCRGAEFVFLVDDDILYPPDYVAQTLERIAALRPGIRQLFLSGYPADVVHQRINLAVDAHFLQKPFSLQALAMEVQAALA